MSVGALIEALGVISRDYSSSGQFPALGSQPKHQGKSLARLPRCFLQPHRPLATRTHPNNNCDRQRGHQAHCGFIENQLLLVKLHLHHNNHAPRQVSLAAVRREESKAASGAFDVSDKRGLRFSPAVWGPFDTLLMAS